MKKFPLFLLACFIFSQANAQLLNPGFEITDTLNRPDNWQYRNFLLVSVDSTCIHLGADSTNFLTHEAHSGNNAIEIRNESFCGDVYSGSMKQIRFRADTFADQRVPFSARPSAFTFWYKLFPVGGDGGKVAITLETETGDEVAGADMVITSASLFYQKAIIPLSYRMVDSVKYVNIMFSLRNAAGLHYGSRFLIDDINQVATGVTSVTRNDGIKCYPIPTTDVLNIKIDELIRAKANCRVTDALGRTLLTKELNFKDGKAAFGTGELSVGIYYLTLVSEGQVFSTRFYK